MEQVIHMYYHGKPLCHEDNAMIVELSVESTTVHDTVTCTACEEKAKEINAALPDTPLDTEKVERVIRKRNRSLIGSGNYCPDCGGLCGNSKHDRKKW